jgi:hypothetical protein
MMQKLRKTEIRELVKSLVYEYPDGISLTHLHHKVHREVTRLQLRTLLGALYAKGQITRERVTEFNRRETKYYPFNGQPPVKRAKNKARESDSKMLSMKDFMPGKRYRAYLDF